MTVRQIFYSLTTQGVIAKTEAEYKHTVCRLLAGHASLRDDSVHLARRRDPMDAKASTFCSVESMPWPEPQRPTAGALGRLHDRGRGLA